MNDKKILISDYDGTFYVNSIDIKKNIDLVKTYKDKGNLFVIATGNNYERFKNIIEKYHISYDYLILDQGSVIVSKDKVLKCTYIEHETVYKIIKEIEKEIKEFDINLETTKENCKFKFCSPLSESAKPNEKDITKISFSIKSIKKAKKITKILNMKFKNSINAYTMIFSHTNIVEIISKETNKKAAIEYLSKITKIKKQNINVIGNGYNDIEMISEFNGYCMKKSVSELLKVCNNQVDSVSELIKLLIKTR